MKRKFFLFSSISLFLYSQSLAVNPIPKELNIYRDGSFLISEYITTVKGWKDINMHIPKNSLIFLEPLHCNLEYVESQKLKSLKRYKELKEEAKTLEAQILALENTLKLSNNIDFEKHNSYINSSKILETFFEKKYLEFVELREKLKKIKKDLNYIETKIEPVGVSVFCPSIETVKIKTRSPINAEGRTFYYVLGDTKKNSVYIENRLNVKVDRNLKSIKVNIFPYNANTYHKVEAVAFAPRRMFKSKSLSPREYTEGTARYFYTIKNVSLKKDLRKNILVSKAEMPATFQIVINGNWDTKPSLVAYVKPKKMFPGGEAYFYIDGVFLKRGVLSTLERSEKNKIYFGEDKLVKVRKEKVKDITVKLSKTHQRRYVKWRYTIKNKHDKSISVKLIDFIPVSNSYKIKIEPVSSKLWKKYYDVSGKLVWEFNIPAGKEFILEFGYKETKPIEKKKEK